MDFFKKYKKKQTFNKFSIIATSFALALAINVIFLNNNFSSSNMKASILETERQENKADIFLEKENNNKFSLKTNYDIKNIDSLSLSFIYNPENLVISNFLPRLNSNLDILTNSGGVSTIIINYKDNYSIKSGEEILNFKFEKKSPKTDTINIINSNFTNSKGQVFELTNKGISF